jgi:ornithine carbamoyltransferase
VNTQLINHPQPVPVPAPKFAPKDLISTRDLSPKDAEGLLHLAGLMKARPADFRDALSGKQLVMFFEKASLRTRLTFEAGMASMGGVSFFFDQTQGRLDAREKLSDIAHNLERWIDVIVLRTYDQSTIEGMAEHASVPVINALSNLEHPCQALADYMTLQERFGDLQNVTLAYVGDGNNVANSLLLTCAVLGSQIRIATPAGYGVDKQILADARKIARKTDAKIDILTDPHAAVGGADAIYTDQWTSMGWENEQQSRAVTFPPYQVNETLMSEAAQGALFMHCLPAHRGEEVTDAVIDSETSVVFDQAENRMHIQKAILYQLLGGSVSRMPVRSAHV